MKKEKIIKTHTRRTKSGKIVTVRQHRAKYDAAEEAKQLAKKIGAGDELESLKKKGKYEVLGVDLSKMSDEDFKEFAFGFMDENDKPAPKTRGAFKKWVENQNWGSEGAANFREGVAEYMKNGGAKGIGSSKKDKVSRTSAPKSEPSYGCTAEEYKAWYHWDAAGDPKNKTALAVEKKLRAKMGRSEYNKYFDELTNSYSSRGHLKAYKALEPETAKAIKSNKMVAGTAEAQKEVAKLQGAKKAEKIFDAKEKEAKGNLNKLSGKGTDKATSDKVINSIVKNYKGASDTVLNRMTKEALAVDDKENTFSKDWSRTKKLAVLKKGLSTSDLTPEDFAALHKKSLRYAKETPKVVGWKKKNGTEVAKYNTEEKSKPSPDNVSKQVKFKAKEGSNYRMSDGSILTYIGEKKGEHKFKDFKTGKIKFKDSDTIYALAEQKKFKDKERNRYFKTGNRKNIGIIRAEIRAEKRAEKGIPDTNKPRKGPKPPARAMGR